MPEVMRELRNLTSQAELKARVLSDNITRKTLSFYQYHPIAAPQAFRDQLYIRFEELGVLGRIYVASEGINAQLSVPEANFPAFVEFLNSFDFLRGIRLNIAIEDDGKSFWVLNVKVRQKIVADGIEDPTFSMERRGQYLTVQQFNEVTADPETIVVDMRNYYEYEVGHFENALEVPSDTFREQLPMAVEMLQEKRDKNIVMYCTGGIRCEKASAYLMHHGFQNVYHLEGGIIEYIRRVEAEGLENKFHGKNFVFDNRMGEHVSGEVISHCHQCGEKSDTHRNCANAACHLLFIQCEKCAAAFHGCCSTACRAVLSGAAEATAGQPEFFNNSQRRPRARAFDLKK